MPILSDIHDALRAQQYRVSIHAVDEMAADGLFESDILSATFGGEVIEDYPSAFPHPACLVLGRLADQAPLHTVWAFDAGGCYATLITTYRPDPARWSDDFRTRVKR